jgi:D-alanyl-D-alanine carboxypeptidase
MSNEEYPNLIDTNESNEKNHFPILMQLGVLGLILVGIFSVLFFHNTNNQVIGELPPAPIQDNAAATVLIPQKITAPNLQAKAAYVWDVRAQRALYASNESTPLPIASITKLMTTLLSYELIEQNEVTTVSQNAILQEGSSGFSIGEQLTVEDLTQMALIS